MAVIEKKFPSEMDHHEIVIVGDKLMIHNLSTGKTEWCTVAELLAAGGTKYWSCLGIHFDAKNPDTDAVLKSTDGAIQAEADNIFFVAPVFLPNGAVITAAKVFGDVPAEAETWNLYRLTLSTGAVGIMGTGNINTEDTTILLATVDNSLYSYYFNTTSFDTGDEIWGARITYTI